VKTSKGKPRDLAASVRQRLLTRAKERGEEFTFVLTRFALERLLFRIGQSGHAGRFVLKGAMLFPLWSGSPHRTTKDMDLLGYGSPDRSQLVAMFRELAEMDFEDGLTFDPKSVAAIEIREDAVYDGIRVTLTAHLSATRIPLQIDVGFGDDVVPAPVEVPYPTLLDLPPPRLRVYPRERRRTPLPVEPPVGLTPAFANDPAKQKQWIAFVARSRLLEKPEGLPEVINKLGAFLWPVIGAAAPAMGSARGFLPVAGSQRERSRQHSRPERALRVGSLGGSRDLHPTVPRSRRPCARGRPGVRGRGVTGPDAIPVTTERCGRRRTARRARAGLPRGQQLRAPAGAG
jgi:hypothetical protein